jgi:hypothetical protein
MNKKLKKLNCKQGNYQCGGRCIRGNWKCKKNIKPEISKQIERSTDLINKLVLPKPIAVKNTDTTQVKKQGNQQSPFPFSPPSNQLFLSPKEALELKNKKIKKIADDFKVEVEEIRKRVVELDEEFFKIIDDDSLDEDEFIIKEKKINADREELNNKAKGIARELIFNEIKKKNGINDPAEVEKKLKEFIGKKNENLKKFPKNVREQIINGARIALENFGKVIDINKYEIIPYNKDIAGSQYNSLLNGYNDGEQIAIKPGDNVLETVVHEFAHDIEENFYIMKNLKRKLKEVGIKEGEGINDIELELPDDEVVRKYANRLYGSLSESGDPDITGTEIITTLLQLLAADGIDINMLINENGDLKQQIFIVLEALL